MQSPPPVEAPAFAPLPLRARSVLETLDIAVKVYKQYFWVLLGWSAVVILCSGVGAAVGMIVPFGGTLPSAMLTPLMTGIVSCCIAAAVRGQKVTFRQCWQFTQPRFWAMVGYYLLALIIAGLLLAVLTGLAFGAGFAGVWALSSAPQVVQVITGTVGGVILLTVATALATVILTWHYLVPVVVCMEEDKQNSQALKRAYELLRHHWVQVCTLMTLVSLGLIVFALILLATWSLLIGLPTVERAFTGQHVDTSQWWEMGVATVLTYLGLWVVAKPIFHLILVLFYFDVRVRQEALDLEWAAHVTAPPPEAGPTPAPASAPGEFYSFTTPNYAMVTPNDPYQVTVQPAAAAWAPGAPVPDGVAAPQGAWTAAAAQQAAMPQTAAPPAASPQAESPAPVDLTPASPAPLPPTPTVAAPPTSEVVTCPQCGATSPPSHVFCMRCGTRLKPPATAPPGGSPQW